MVLLCVMKRLCGDSCGEPRCASAATGCVCRVVYLNFKIILTLVLLLRSFTKVFQQKFIVVFYNNV